MAIDIDHLSVEELVALNHRIVERLKCLEAAQAHQDMMAFNLGARVSFDAPREGRQLATVVKFNRKTLTVLSDTGRRWNVSPHLLSAVNDTRPRQSVIDASKSGPR